MGWRRPTATRDESLTSSIIHIQFWVKVSSSATAAFFHSIPQSGLIMVSSGRWNLRDADLRWTNEFVVRMHKGYENYTIVGTTVPKRTEWRHAMNGRECPRSRRHYRLRGQAGCCHQESLLSELRNNDKAEWESHRKQISFVFLDSELMKCALSKYQHLNRVLPIWKP